MNSFSVSLCCVVLLKVYSSLARLSFLVTKSVPFLSLLLCVVSGFDCMCVCAKCVQSAL